MGTTYTSAGEALITDLIDFAAQGTTATFTAWFINWGTGTVTDQKSDTGLGNEATEVRVTATTETQTAADTMQWKALQTCDTVTRDVGEAALFTLATVGTCLIRGTYTDISLATDDQVEYTITLQQT